MESCVQLVSEKMYGISIAVKNVCLHPDLSGLRDVSVALRTSHGVGARNAHGLKLDCVKRSNVIFLSDMV